jgi:DNA-binding Lrp family transcriptional regulator
MTTAYILIQAEVGRIGQVVKALLDVDAVQSAAGVTGPYDVIAYAEAATIDDLGRLVVTRIQAIQGIARTLTCPVIHIDTL